LPPASVLGGIGNLLEPQLHAVIDGMHMLLNAGNALRDPTGVYFGADLIVDQQVFVEVFRGDDVFGRRIFRTWDKLAEVVGDEGVAVLLMKLRMKVIVHDDAAPSY